MRSSFLAIRTVTGCMHSKWLPGSKYMHCLQECNSKPHLGQRPSGGIPGSIVPHCVQRETARVPGRFTGLGPKVLSFLGCGVPDRSPDERSPDERSPDDPLRESSRSRS